MDLPTAAATGITFCTSGRRGACTVTSRISLAWSDWANNSLRIGEHHLPIHLLKTWWFLPHPYRIRWQLRWQGSRRGSSKLEAMEIRFLMWNWAVDSSQSRHNFTHRTWTNHNGMHNREILCVNVRSLNVTQATSASKGYQTYHFRHWQSWAWTPYSCFCAVLLRSNGNKKSKRLRRLNENSNVVLSTPTYHSRRHPSASFRCQCTRWSIDDNISFIIIIITIITMCSSFLWWASWNRMNNCGSS